MKLIGIDVDGILAEQIDAALTYIKETLGLEVYTKSKEIDTWNHKIKTNKGPILIDDFFDKAFSDTEFTLLMKPIVGVNRSIKKLSRKHRIIILTARKDRNLSNTKKWLKKYKIYYDEIKYAEPKEKAKYPIDILIDDNPRTAVMAVSNGKKVLMLGKPYNRNLSWLNKVEIEKFRDFRKQQKISIHNNWSGIINYINKL